MTLIQLNPTTYFILQVPVNQIIIISMIIDIFNIFSTLFLIIIYVQNYVLNILYCYIVHTIYTNLHSMDTYHIYTYYLPTNYNILIHL